MDESVTNFSIPETSENKDYPIIFQKITEGDYTELEWVGQGTFSEVYDYQLPTGDRVVVKVTSDRETRESLLAVNQQDIEFASKLGERGKAPVVDSSLETAIRVQAILDQYNAGEYPIPQPASRLNSIHFARILSTHDDGKLQIEVLESIEFLDTKKSLLVGLCLAELGLQGINIHEIKKTELLRLVTKRLNELRETINSRRLENTLVGLLRLDAGGLDHLNFLRLAFTVFKERFPVLLVDTKAGKLPIGDITEENSYPVITENEGGTKLEFWVSDLIPMERRILPIRTTNIENFNLSHQ